MVNYIPDFEGGGYVRLSDTEIDRNISRYILDLENREAAPRHGDINEFFPLVQNAVLSRQNYERVPEDKRLLFLEEDPPESLNSPAITFEISSRVPGRVDQGSAGVGNIKEVRPHYRGEREHPEHPGEKLVAMGKYYDNWIRFYIQTKTSKEARKLLLWFEKMMDGFNWYFRYNGFRVVEEGAGEKERIEIEGITLTRYSIVYMVRSEDVHHFSAQELKEVILSPTLATS